MTDRHSFKAGGCVVVGGLVLLLSACRGSEPAEDANIAASTPGQEIFDRTCFACHSIGQGPRVGPDLKDIHTVRDRDWLVRWLRDPLGMIENDPIGQEIFAQWNNVPMAPPNLSDEDIGHALQYIEDVSEGRIVLAAEDDGSIDMTDAEFAAARQIYFDRCAGCHGTLRAGATGPNIQPERTTVIGTAALRATLANGLPGGMPPWGRQGILSADQIDLMARYVQHPPPDAPAKPLSEVRASWELLVPLRDRPTAPITTRDWQNYFGVILRDAGQVAIMDGDSHDLIKIIPTGFAVIEGCYWPPQYIVYDGLTLEPLTVTGVEGNTYDTDEPLNEVRVASIVASHFGPYWVLALKESGHVGIVDYSQPGFPMISRIPSERFLHDGGWDHTGRYFLVAANMRDQMVVIDVREQEMVTKFETGIRPHPGRGANWQDPEFGWVNATTHLGQPLLTVYGADPENSPDHAWKPVRKVTLPNPGSLFLKTHPNSPWVWMDMALSNDPEGAKEVCVYSKSSGEIERCFQVGDRGRAVHFEYNRAGTEVWVSVWDADGELVIYDDATLEVKERIRADWLVTPTGKFNVYNTAEDIY